MPRDARDVVTGTDVSTVFARARERFGEDVRVLRLERHAHGFALEVARAARAVRIQPLRPVFSTRAGRGDPRRIALVGPTGSGKTTTLAKLANHASVFGADAVGILCLDTYRVGAVEQARAWAELSRLPFEVAWERAEIRRAMRRLDDLDVVLVDTAGRSPARRDDLDELGGMLQELEPDELHLTIPAGLESRRARAVLLQHRALGVTHVIATKLDEYPEDRVVRDLAAEHGLAMRWVTNGQEVPADLAWAGEPAAEAVS
jgi:flagellar biosynthesis protein FlhF